MFTPATPFVTYDIYDMTEEMKRVRVGLSNIIVIGQTAIDGSSVRRSQHGLHEISRFAKEQIRYLDSIAV